MSTRVPLLKILEQQKQLFLESFGAMACLFSVLTFESRVTQD